MYFYTLSDGCYADYYEVVLFHENKWTKEHFAQMFNEAIDNGHKDSLDLADYLIENHGFKKVQPEIFVKCDYGSYKRLAENDHSEDGVTIDAEDRSWRNK